MLREAIRPLGRAPRTAVRALQEPPTAVTGLTASRQTVSALPGLGVTVVPVPPAPLAAAQGLCAQDGLLTHDALLNTVTRVLGLTDLASHDSDFTRLPGVRCLTDGLREYCTADERRDPCPPYLRW